MNKNTIDLGVNCIFDENLVNLFDTAYYKVMIKIAVIVDTEGIEVLSRIYFSYINLFLNVSCISQFFNESSRNVNKINTNKF